VVLHGEVPGLDETAQAMLRVRVLDAVRQAVRTVDTGPFDLRLTHGPVNDRPPAAARTEPDAQAEADFTAVEPAWKLENLVLPAPVKDMLLDCVAYVAVAPRVFGTWNLRSIEPHPSMAMNFRGPPGTGKTMAAHALASMLNRKILLSRLSDLESKYHGDGPKNVVKLFESAARQNAVLFIDEAESMLSRRYAQPDQAAESAINSMRTELLMALDAFEGLAIFATNLHDSYDPAISSRLTHVDFPLPDRDGRRGIWLSHLPRELPLGRDVDVDALAAIEGVTGRDIKRAVLAAAISAARRELSSVPMALLEGHLRRQVADSAPRQQPLAPVALGALEAEVAARLSKNNDRPVAVAGG
jgi:SpoVK/Ycf46/Vps4 family AAA+-type ATPase